MNKILSLLAVLVYFTGCDCEGYVDEVTTDELNLSNVYEKIAPGVYEGQLIVEDKTYYARLTITDGSDIIDITYDPTPEGAQSVRYQYFIPMKILDGALMQMWRSESYTRRSYIKSTDSQWVVDKTVEMTKLAKEIDCVYRFEGNTLTSSGFTQNSDSRVHDLVFYLK